MYGERIAKIMKDNGLKIGDMVSIKDGDSCIEGEIMPSTEYNSEDVLVLKLKNGYNIGIYLHGSEIKKISGKNNASANKFAAVNVQGNLPKVSLIYTGGTIGSRIDYKAGGVYMLTKAEELLYEVPEMASIANLSIDSLLSIASEDMNFIEWQQIAREAAKKINEGYRGVVITHGTDTMHYTAAALSFMLRNLSAPVVLTGSQRSSDRGSSDAFMNLICSTYAAANSDIAEVGICMHASSSDDKCMYIRGTKARKMHTSARSAFRPINDKAIAYVHSNGRIEYAGSYKKREEGKKVELAEKFESKVALVKFYPNSDPGIIDFYAGKGYKGIIIEGTGLGHVAVSTIHKEYDWKDSIKRAVDKGIVVGMASQCIYGRVNTNVYRNLRILSGLGVVYCKDMTAETALVKLGWLLGNYNENEAKSLLDKNIAGEIKDREEYGEFLL
ncbi:MAG: Glu-tRNA(Gln) amidotransferase subunit GatD [Candidatus Micrarchaeaceae archaeon]